ncbi:MAG TPA: fasciclin domain-containing protein [Leptolyngbyaceae cyanobacterium]
MSRHTFTRFLGMTAGLLVIPALSACNRDTAQAPVETAPTQPAPAVQQTPSTPVASTPTATTGPTRTLAEVAAFDNSLSSFNAALETAEMKEALSGPGPYTIFAPSNAAFEAIPITTRERLLSPENRATLVQVLSYHVVPEALPADQIAAGDAASLSGQPLAIRVDQSSDQITVNNARVIQSDIEASNGVIHMIDQVILPPGFNP